jgi:hypothetical protein
MVSDDGPKRDWPLLAHMCGEHRGIRRSIAQRADCACDRPRGWCSTPLGIEAPKEIKIQRAEVAERKRPLEGSGL